MSLLTEMNENHRELLLAATTWAMKSSGWRIRKRVTIWTSRRNAMHLSPMYPVQRFNSNNESSHWDLSKILFSNWKTAVLTFLWLCCFVFKLLKLLHYMAKSLWTHEHRTMCDFWAINSKMLALIRSLSSLKASTLLGRLDLIPFRHMYASQSQHFWPCSVYSILSYSDGSGNKLGINWALQSEKTQDQEERMWHITLSIE